MPVANAFKPVFSRGTAALKRHCCSLADNKGEYPGKGELIMWWAERTLQALRTDLLPASISADA